jgi:hypothetical protein
MDKSTCLIKRRVETVLSSNDHTSIHIPNLDKTFSSDQRGLRLVNKRSYLLSPESRTEKEAE